jgi:hypothetical protein
MRFMLTRPATPHTPLPASRAAFHRAKAARTLTGLRWFLLAILTWGPLWALVSLGLMWVFMSRSGSAPPDAANTIWNLIQRGAQNTDALGLLIFWIGIVWVAPLFYRSMHDISARNATREGTTLWRRRDKFLRRAFRWIVALSAAATLISIAFPRSRMMGLMVVAMPVSFLSLQALILGLKSRIGPFLTCTRCGYRMSSWRRAKDPCPECGNLWKQPWGAALGVPGIRWDLVAWGAGLQLASLLAMVWLISRLP